MKKTIILGIILAVIIISIAICLIDWGLTPPKWILGVWRGKYKHQFSGEMITETWIFKKKHVSSTSTNGGKMDFKREFFIDYGDKSTNDEYTIIIYSILEKDPFYLRFKKISENKLNLVGENLSLYRIK